VNFLGDLYNEVGDVAQGTKNFIDKVVGYKASDNAKDELARAGSAWHSGNGSESLNHLRKATTDIVTNHPAAQMASQQWDASIANRDKAVEAGKKGHIMDAIAHGTVGVAPFVNVAVDAIDKAHDNPTLPNVTHALVTLASSLAPYYGMFRGSVPPEMAPDVTPAAEPVSTVSPRATPVMDTVGNAVDAVKRQMAVSKGVSHVYDPETGTVQPVGDIGSDIKTSDAGSTKQAAGISVQRAMTNPEKTGVLDIAGKNVRTAKAAAQEVPISGNPSSEFRNAVQNVADEANKPTLSSIPSDEMGNVKALAEELQKRVAESDTKPMTHDEFNAYSKQIGDKISDLENSKTDQSARTLYTKLKSSLQTEYLNQLEDSDPQMAQHVKDVNGEYAELAQRYNKGAASKLFHTVKPEDIVNRIVSGAAKESEVGDILQTARAYDAAHPEGFTGDGTTVEQYIKKQTLYNQMRRFGERFDTDGNLVRVNPDKMIADLDKNAATYRDIYGKDFGKIRESLVEEANRLRIRDRNINTLKTAGKTAGGVAKYGALTAVGLQLLGVPVVPTIQSLWNIVSPPKQ
jgi:hypothetical protein